MCPSMIRASYQQIYIVAIFRLFIVHLFSSDQERMQKNYVFRFIWVKMLFKKIWFLHSFSSSRCKRQSSGVLPWTSTCPADSSSCWLGSPAWGLYCRIVAPGWGVAGPGKVRAWTPCMASPPGPANCIAPPWVIATRQTQQKPGSLLSNLLKSKHFV